MEVNELVRKLYEAKQDEIAARGLRVELESQLAGAIGVPEDWDGCMTRLAGPFRVRMERRTIVKIDALQLWELASANNLVDVLKTLFRWKPELNKREWKLADGDVRRILAPAMEITPGKVCFTVTPVNEEE